MSNREKINAWVAGHVARSSRFVVCYFVGRENGLYDKREASGLIEAQCIASIVLAEYGNTNFKRPCMIYAVTPDNLSIHVENIRV